MRLCPGNEAMMYAEKIVKLVHKFEDEDPEYSKMMEQLTEDDADVDNLLKNDEAIMQGIVSLSRLVTAMHEDIKRIGGLSAEGRKGNNPD